MTRSPKPSSGGPTADRRSGDELRRRLSQQAAAAELGRVALAGAEVSVLATTAVTMIARELGIPFVVLLAADDERGPLTLRASVGMPESIRALEVIPAADPGQMGYTLREAVTVVSRDLAAERRFTPPAVLMSLGVRSTASVPVGVHA